MFDYYGFSAKYCSPSHIVGKRINYAKIYLGIFPVAEYFMDKATGKPCLIFADKETELLFKEAVKEASKVFPVPEIPLLFVMQMLSFLEIYYNLKYRIKRGESGIVATFDEDGFLEHILPIEEDEDVFLKKIEKQYEKKEWFVFHDYEKFIVQDILARKERALPCVS